jgi:hypothetical protein
MLKESQSSTSRNTPCTRAYFFVEGGMDTYSIEAPRINRTWKNREQAPFLQFNYLILS